MLNLKKLSAGLLLSCFTLTAFAIDSVAKEDTTPPTAEGPLTANQIAPIISIPAPLAPPQAAAPTPTPPAQ